MSEPVFPLALRLTGRRCLVVGSGREAARRVRDLLEAGARVRLIAEAPCTGLDELTADAAVTLERRRFEEKDLQGVWLAVLADRDPELAERIGTATTQRQILFCAVNQPRTSSFLHMARARAGPVQLAISTAGQAPSLGRRLAGELARLFDEADLAAFARKISALRARTPSAERSGVLGDAVAGVRFAGKLELPRED